MENLLPIVDSDIGHAIAHSLGNDTDWNTIKQQMKHIKKHNPTIAEFIQRWCENEKNAAHSALCGILVYRLLESQAEADQMLDFKLG